MTNDSSNLYVRNAPKPEYYDKRSKLDRESYFKAISSSKTLYVGGLNLYTTEEKLYSFFSSFAHIKSVIVGVHKKNYSPCGFCFIVCYKRRDAEVIRSTLNGMFLDGRKIMIDYDLGFVDGRQYGRGFSGGQVKDEHIRDINKGVRDGDDDGKNFKRRKYE